MAKIAKVDVETRLAKGAAAVKTALSLDWEGVSEADMLELATRSVVINIQRVFRDAGKIPATYGVKVSDFLAGKGRPDKVITPEKILAQAEKFSPEQAAELIKKLQAMQAPKPAAKK